MSKEVQSGVDSLNPTALFVPKVRQSVGITETEEAFEALIELKKAIEDANEDGKIDTGDISLLFGIFPKLMKGIAGGQNIPAELKDLDDNEIAQLSDKFGEAFDSPNYRKMFYGFALIADGIYDEIQLRKSNTDIA